MTAADRLLDSVACGLRADVAADARRERLWGRKAREFAAADRRSALADALDGPGRRALRHRAVTAWPTLVEDAAASVVAALSAEDVPVGTLRNDRKAYGLALSAATSVISTGRPVEVPETVRERAKAAEHLIEEDGYSVADACVEAGTTPETLAAVRAALAVGYADPVEASDVFAAGAPMVDGSPVADQRRLALLRGLIRATETAIADDVLQGADVALLSAAMGGNTNIGTRPTVGELARHFDVDPSTIRRRLDRLAGKLAPVVHAQGAN